MADDRVDFRDVLDAFGVPCVVKIPDADPVACDGAWILPTMDQFPVGSEAQVSERHKLIAFSKDDLPRFPLKVNGKPTRIVAPERLSEDDKGWIADEIVLGDPDHHRVLVIPDPAYVAAGT